MLKTIVWGESESTWQLKGLKMKPEVNTSMKRVEEGQSES